MENVRFSLAYLTDIKLIISLVYVARPNKDWKSGVSRSNTKELDLKSS